tara:strand:+ start:4415 stop:5158 length:744 start_codon:yes stop_codon:yes gene_type:complete
LKVLVLGHNGMLGHMVYKYLSTKNDCKITTTNFRWPTKKFKDFVQDFWWNQEGSYIINCIGAILQKTSEFDVNTDLPIWLDDNIDYNFSSCKIIHPGTDCEIDDDDYGNSKRKATEYLLEKGCMTKIIKTSIIGPELNSKVSLLEWFLNSDGQVFGYTEVYWNGNTTLQWAKLCYNILKKYDEYDLENVLYTECISKYKLLNIINDVYKKNISVIKDSNVKINKCLKGNIVAPDIKKQLTEMKDFYK